MNRIKEHCKMVAGSDASGEIVYSSKPVNFYLVDPVTSEIIEEKHPLKGTKVKGKALVIPSGKGSSVVQIDGLYQLVVKGNAPSLIVIKEPDPVIVSASFICDVPLVSGISTTLFSELEKGGKLTLEYKSQTLELTQ